MGNTNTTTDTRTTRQLKKQLTAQSDTIGQLRDRVNTMCDEIFILKNEITKFQERVQSDMTTVFDELKKR